jgi:hypothetical protein
METNLSDDMVKLVRFSIVNIERDREEIVFPKGEEIVTDSMTDDAFAAWMISKHVKLPDPKGNGDEDPRKYLRVSYEVLSRWAKQDRKFEKRQLDVLGDIRDAIQNKPRVDPYQEYFHRLELSQDAFAQWRDDLSRCAEQAGEDIGNAFNRYRTVGHFEAPELDVDQVREALKKPLDFHRDLFDMFTGPARGDLRIYRPQRRGEPTEEKAPAVHSIWGPVVEKDGRLAQKITGSNYDYFEPESRKIPRLVAAEKVDLIFNTYTADQGALSWSSFYQNHDNQMRSIGYDLGERLLWINQFMTPDMKPIKDDQFVLSIDFAEEDKDQRRFLVYAMHLDFDFATGKAKFAGPILKMLNTVVPR